LLLHVVDISHPNYDEQIETVNRVLEELGASEKPTILVFNKVDAVKEDGVLEQLTRKYDPCLMISAKRGIFIDQVKQEIESAIVQNLSKFNLRSLVNNSKSLAQIHELSDVIKIKYSNGYADIFLQTSKERIKQILQLPGVKLVE